MTATSQTIWDVLADFGALSAWAPGAAHSCVLTRGPGGQVLGTTRRVQLGRAALVERIVDFEPPTMLAYDVEGLPARLRTVTNRWTLRPAGDATMVTLTSTVDVGSGPLARAAEWAVCLGMAKESDAMLAGLALATEKTHG